MKSRSLTLAALSACLFACSLARAAGSLTYCADGSPEGFDIAQYETVVTNDAAIPVYEQLLAFKPGSTELVPGLAQRWDISADGREYTLHLRHGVKFHSTAWFKPTREMNADDVLWSLNRINDARHPAHAAARNGFPYWAGMSMPGLIQGIARLDDYTVRITLTHPEAPFLADLAMSALASIYSAEYGEQLTRAGKLEELNTQPIGTGPYAFKSYQKDAVIRYVAHNAYWGGKPALDQLVFAITPDPSVRAQRVKAGECAVANVIGEQAESLASDGRIAVVPNPQLTTSYVAPNAKRRFLSDKRFRLALSLAIDRASLVKSVYGGYATVATSFVPPGIWSHDAGLANPQDIEKAKALVKASGYDGSELTLFSVARRSDNKRAVELLQADWARIGVKVRPQLMELGELYKRTGKGEHDLAFLSWFSDNGDPDNFLSPNLACAAVEGGGNKAQWCDKTLDALLAQARATTDLKRRTQLYLQAQKLLHDETGLIPIANKQGLSAVRKDVRGYQATLFGGNDFRAARIGD